jgi:hypothetical protein
MTLTLGLQAAAVYGCALALARCTAPATRRTVLLTAVLLVVTLPLFPLLPTWSPPTPVHEVQGLLRQVAALQEPTAAAEGLPAPGPLPWGTLAAVAWALGLVVGAARLARDLLAVRRLKATACDVDGDVAYSREVDSPVVVGVLRPLILLPEAARTWAAPVRAMALAHERAHLAGRDNTWLLLARVAAVVHWFDPLAWRALGALQASFEDAADAAVLATGADPVGYADTLLAVARGRGPVAGLPMARTEGLEARVRAVLGGATTRRRLGPPLAAALIAATMATATASPEAGPWGGVQLVIEGEADRLVEAWHPDGVAIVVVDAHTGVVVGRADRGGLADRPVAPGSVLKPFVVAAALEVGVPQDLPGRHGSMADVLERSSNDGALEIARLAGRPAVAGLLARVGLGVPDAAGLEALALGSTPTMTPTEVAVAYHHLAGHGAVSAEIAERTRTLLLGAVYGEHATGGRAAVPGTPVVGKTGTAPLLDAAGHERPGQFLTSFVGLVPADEPKLVVLVSVSAPNTDSPWGGQVAAPSFRRIVEGL